MNETKPSDPLGKWAPYIRWVILVAILILGPRIGLTPGDIPPLPSTTAQQIADTNATVRVIKAEADQRHEQLAAQLRANGLAIPPTPQQ